MIEKEKEDGRQGAPGVKWSMPRRSHAKMVKPISKNVVEFMLVASRQ